MIHSPMVSEQYAMVDNLLLQNSHMKTYSIQLQLSEFSLISIKMASSNVSFKDKNSITTSGCEEAMK